MSNEHHTLASTTASQYLKHGSAFGKWGVFVIWGGETSVELCTKDTGPGYARRRAVPLTKRFPRS
jgi:hypothetical protein